MIHVRKVWKCLTMSKKKIVITNTLCVWYGLFERSDWLIIGIQISNKPFTRIVLSEFKIKHSMYLWRATPHYQITYNLIVPPRRLEWYIIPIIVLYSSYTLILNRISYEKPIYNIYNISLLVSQVISINYNKFQFFRP